MRPSLPTEMLKKANEIRFAHLETVMQVGYENGACQCEELAKEGQVVAFKRIRKPSDSMFNHYIYFFYLSCLKGLAYSS